MPEYQLWHQLFDTTAESVPTSAMQSGSGTEAPPRSVLAFAGAAA
jgi:glycogen operon protein